ncbi:hypothetical protein J4E93_005136 [Alternaria ventricosa]|uniref:uncharacterized protein n=1 Tax=Alternaria ventricosa TaxID=1187951 RepID=UPI0020C373E5|nr:uncharacterized protein J4E93_005136 [Alternaria ventricosa]KAI4646912.1 hypothetical protein J4E93_005136 [Alternaria ventricosa]
MLDEEHPGIIAQLPSPESFVFQRGPHNEHMLSIGSHDTKNGIYGIFVTQKSSVKPRLHYKHSNGVDAGLTAGQRFQGNQFFGKMTVSGQLRPYTHEIKAMIAFVFLYCGKQPEFFDFAHGGATKLLVKDLTFVTGNQSEFTIYESDGVSKMRVKRVLDIAGSQEDEFSNQGCEDENADYTEVSDIDAVEDSADKEYDQSSEHLDNKTSEVLGQLPKLSFGMQLRLNLKMPVARKVVKLKVRRQTLHKLSDKTLATSKTYKERKLRGEYDGTLSAGKGLKLRLSRPLSSHMQDLIHGFLAT